MKLHIHRAGSKATIDTKQIRRALDAGPMSPEYQAAREKHSAAFRKFDQIRNDYRARKIGDPEFIAAKREYEAATREFDIAFSKEETRGTGDAVSFQSWMVLVEHELMRLHGLDPSDLSINWRASHANGRSVREAVDLAAAGRLRD